MSRPRDPLYESVVGRRASSEQVALRHWIHEWYQAHPEALPARFRYYEAVMAGVIAKHAAQTVQAVAAGVTVTKGDVLWKAALMWVRENGLVPDSWVQDRTRRLYNYTGYRSIADGVLARLGGISIDPWDDEAPLLVVESESSAAALEVVASEYRIRMAPLRGQAGRAYLANVVAPTLIEDQVVLAVVDLDKVGDDISTSARQRLERFRDCDLDWRVVALTDEQVDEHGIIRVPRTDGRDGIERMVAETEALGADTLRTIVRAELDALLREPLVAVRGRERDQRLALRRAIRP